MLTTRLLSWFNSWHSEYWSTEVHLLTEVNRDRLIRTYSTSFLFLFFFIKESTSFSICFGFKKILSMWAGKRRAISQHKLDSHPCKHSEWIVSCERILSLNHCRTLQYNFLGKTSVSSLSLS